MAGNRQILTLKNRAADVLIKEGIFSVEVSASTSLPYQQRVSAVLEQVIHEQLLPVFLQAVVDDDQKKVAELLDKNPELLLVKALKGIEIQSQYTWLTIDVEDEDALSIAAKFKQIKMIELLLHYYEKLEQTEEVIQAKAEGLAAWKTYETQKNADGEDEIIIPKEYASHAKSLMDVLKEETFPNGTKGKFSEKTENALKLLFDKLLPKKAVKLDDYIDPELFLLALYTAYRDGFGSFQNWDQRDAFGVRMIGLAQSALSPETAKIFCEGIYYVVDENRIISERASSLKLLDGKSFYRASREPFSGLGFEYLCGAGGGGGVRGWRCWCASGRWRSYVEQKQQFFGTLRSNSATCQTNLANRKPASCVIF